MFYACYLLKSLKAGADGKCYVGSTPDPVRRIRQHNGEIQGGAKKTASGRPWIMVVVVSGFPNQIAALQFEWAWQNPHASRHFASTDLYKKSRSHQSLPAKLHVLSDMIHLNQYARWPLRVHVTVESVWNEVLRLPGIGALSGDGDENAPILSFGELSEVPGMRVELDSDLLQKYRLISSASTCVICSKQIDAKQRNQYFICSSTPSCTMTAHIACLAQHFLTHEQNEFSRALIRKPPIKHLLPVSGPCPGCQTKLFWGDLVNIQNIYQDQTEAKDKGLKKVEAIWIEESDSDDCFAEPITV